MGKNVHGQKGAWTKRYMNKKVHGQKGSAPSNISSLKTTSLKVHGQKGTWTKR